MLIEKLTALSVYIFKKERYQIYFVSFYLMKLEKEVQIIPKACRRREIIRIKAEISVIQNRKITRKISKKKKLVFEKTNKINNSLD